MTEQLPDSEMLLSQLTVADALIGGLRNHAANLDRQVRDLTRTVVELQAELEKQHQHQGAEAAASRTD